MSQTISSLAKRALLLAGCLTTFAVDCGADTPIPPEIAREFRGAWIATVANIDWPTNRSLSPDQQRKELTRLLDVAVECRLNAIVLQVRPACDALYRSELEPWSPWLTGKMGRAPSPEYDPLEFAVAEAHKRGLQLHTWFNPYRAALLKGSGELSEGHVSKTIPESVVEYGDYLWLDPGDEAAEEHTLSVIRDVVRRYDVDGVHFDDYFYPYPISEVADDGTNALEESDDLPKREVPFPDDASWEKYLAKTAEADRVNRSEWRRENVNRLVRRVHQAVKQEKPWVAFGVSPFGIWRPGHPPSIKGFDAYEKLYADSKIWMEKAWVDYMAPQLYWPIDSKGQSYPELLNWWVEKNRSNRLLMVGNFTSRVGPTWKAEEIVNQIEVTRQTVGASGNIHFSMKALAGDRGGIATALKEGPYAEPALPPLDDSAAGSVEQPQRPAVTATGSILSLKSQSHTPRLWAIQTSTGGEWRTRVLPGEATECDLAGADHAGPSQAWVRAVDRLGRVSEAVLVTLGDDQSSPNE